jgi:biopolymer transport protein ExbB
MIIGDLIIKGGAVMGVLVAVSVYVSAVVFYKLYQFGSIKVNDFGFIEKGFSYLDKGNSEKAFKVFRQASHPLGESLCLISNTLSEKKLSDDQKMLLIHSIGSQPLERLRLRLKSLEIVANISPLLGLLGTVIGMVKAFSGISDAGSRVDPSMLAGGIWEALLTTVAGLVVAIVSYTAYHYFNAKVEKCESVLENSVAHLYSSVS